MTLVKIAQNFGIKTESRVVASLFFVQLGLKGTLVLCFWLVMMTFQVVLVLLFVFQPVEQAKSLLHFAWLNPFVGTILTLNFLAILSFVVVRVVYALKLAFKVSGERKDSKIP